MSHEIQLRTPDALPDVADPFGSYEACGAPQVSIFKRMHRLLRRRYHWCILLAVIFGGLGAWGGYVLKKPTWVAFGAIQVKSAIDPVLRQTIETSPVTNYDAFVQSQAALLRTQRVIDLAMQSQKWRSLTRDSASPEAVTEFMEQLTIGAIQRSEIVEIRFEDINPRAAVAAVDAILTAYNDIILVENGSKLIDERLKTLERRQELLARDRNGIRDAIGRIAQEFGTDDLRPLHQNKLQDLARLEAALNEVNLLLASIPDQADRKVANRKAEEMTLQDIASVDPEMRQLYRDLSNAEMELAIRRRDWGPGHPRVQDTQSIMAIRRKASEDYATNWRRNNGSAPDAGDPLNPQRKQLEIRRKQYTELVNTAKAETLTLGRKMLEIERLRKEEDGFNVSLTQTKDRIDQLRTESSQNQNRITILPRSERALPGRDTRKQLAVVGGLAGMMFGFLIVLSIAASDRRLRSLDDLRSNTRRLSLLGVLPSLPDDLADPTQASIAAHCVHHIRTLLQIGAPPNQSNVFAITSPASGTGKTSLCLSLGVSFAASNARTLMIDCDLAGGGLTRRVDAIVRRKIGQIFTRAGLISPQQLETALKLARNSQRKIGETLVDLGYLTAEDVNRALASQDQIPVGTLDALAGDTFTDCITETGIQGLSILPLGTAGSADASKISPATVRAMIQHARQHFDTILIDTGPVPGSLEASVVAAAADGVVLVVSRGEHRPLAEKSIQHLQEINARMAGIVFNRAETRDLQVSATQPHMQSAPRSATPAEPMPKFGPVALAVAKPGVPRADFRKPQS